MLIWSAALLNRALSHWIKVHPAVKVFSCDLIVVEVYNQIAIRVRRAYGRWQPNCGDMYSSEVFCTMHKPTRDCVHAPVCLHVHMHMQLRDEAGKYYSLRSPAISCLQMEEDWGGTWDGST